MTLEEIKELRSISSPLMIEREFLVKPTKRFIKLFALVLDEAERNVKSQKEREDNEMEYNVQITKTEDKILEEYWVMRGVMSVRGEKKVILERESERYPHLHEIAQFLSDSGADFVSVEHNFRFGSELPFC